MGAVDDQRCAGSPVGLTGDPALGIRVILSEGW
jgi:hypothetical protein